jgi:hypothetical protein
MNNVLAFDGGQVYLQTRHSSMDAGMTAFFS